LDAIVTGDTSAIDGLLADNFMDYGPGINDSLDRAATIAWYKNNWRNSWKSVNFDRYTMLSVSLKDGKVPGDWVLDWGIVTVKHKDGTPDLKFQWHGVFRMENGKIAQANAFFDQSDILKQIGYKFVPPDLTATSK
ncbi:MAG TPA: nuclear transport factor 2 family protein, partial [Cyclobacteriaceae bacterium]|nr:nuclear transport factor 2 family protein [Cyclobacteriaceae bacterium]